MPTRPSDPYLWAESAAAGDVEEPAIKRAGGFQPDTDVVAEEFNAILRGLGRQINYLHQFFENVSGTVAMGPARRGLMTLFEQAGKIVFGFEDADGTDVEMDLPPVTRAGDLIADMVPKVNALLTITSSSVTITSQLRGGIASVSKDSGTFYYDVTVTMARPKTSGNYIVQATSGDVGNQDLVAYQIGYFPGYIILRIGKVNGTAMSGTVVVNLTISYKG